jgi:hypothetical protein
VQGLAGAIAGPGPEYSKFDKLNDEAGAAFEVVDIDDAQVLVYPYRAAAGAEIEFVAEEARKRKIGCVFYSWGDQDEPLNVSYGTVYRHSMYSSTRLEHESAAPGFVCDPQVELGLPVWPREKREAPRVGFCGYVSNAVVRRMYEVMGRRDKAEGLNLRARVLGALRRTTDIEPNFVMRQSFWAGAHGRLRKNHSREFKPRAVFWNNVLNSDYTVCIRGAGNFSSRFYEVLAAGRVPLFINTRCVLPLEDEIDWKQHCVWVEEDQIEMAGEIVKEFHSSMTAEQYRLLQMSNRRLWETRLSPLGFYKRALAKEVTRVSPRTSDDVEIAAAAAV